MAIPKPAAPMLTRRALLWAGAAVALAGCGRRRAEGGGRWRLFSFGEEEIETLEPEGGYGAFLTDPRPLAPKVDTMEIESASGGVIVRVSAVMPTQEFWDADLIVPLEENPVDGVYRLEFRAWPPFDPSAAAIGTPESRTITAAAFISSGELNDVRTVRVVAEANGLSRSR